MSRRENTFRIDYATLPKRPSYDEIHNFIGLELDMKREEVVRIQCSRYLGCVFVKASDLPTAQRIVDEHDGKHELVIDNKRYPIRLCMEDGGVDVKLYDLSEDVPDQMIIDFLSEFGEVLSIRDLPWEGKYRFEGLSSGIRIARMIVKKNIPSIITVDGESTYVSYNGQLQSCRHCSEQLHNGITCIQNKKLLIQKMTAEQGSYASVTKQPASKKNTKRVPPTVSLPTASTSKTPVTASSSVTRAKQQQTLELSPGSFPPLQPPEPEAHFKQPALKAQPSTSAGSAAQQRHQMRDDEIIRSDGHETDDSTTSTSSRRTRGRPHPKKMRHDTDSTNTNNDTQQ